MGRPARWRSTVDASTDEASLAVRLYNDPAENRSFEGFVVHMHLAWLYLLHAVLTRDGVDFRYWKSDKPKRLERIDGEPKRWELAKCVKYRFPDGDPVRANLEFFIALRNKIEHRFARQQETLALAVGGHSQALLMNYEEELTGQFGQGRSLATRLRFPVFIGTFTEEGEQALRRLRATLPRNLQKFIADYHSGLDPAVEEDHRFEFRVRMTLELVKRGPETLALQFTRYDDMSEEEKRLVEEMGKRGQVVVREQRRPVVGEGLLKAKPARQAVAAALPYRFNQYDFQKAYERLGVRPAWGDDHPERTDEKYCIYDTLNGNYGYTRAYVERLIATCRTPEGFRETTGREPIPR